VILDGIPTQYGWTVYGLHGFILGERTDIGVDVRIFAKYGVVIEDDVQIGAGVKIYSEDTIGGKRGPVVIKKGACIGANSVVLPNVIIGERAIVGALVKVWKDVPAGKVFRGEANCRMNKPLRDFLSSIVVSQMKEMLER